MRDKRENEKEERHSMLRYARCVPHLSSARTIARADAVDVTGVELSQVVTVEARATRRQRQANAGRWRGKAWSERREKICECENE